MSEPRILPLKQLDLFGKDPAGQHSSAIENKDITTAKVLQFPAPRTREKKEQELFANIWEDVQHLKQN
jgi:hypothetical protein